MSFLKTIFRSVCWNIGKILTYLIIGFLLAFILGKKDVFAESSHWLQFTDINNGYICGTSNDSLKCNYTDVTNGVYTNKKIGSYNIIIENLDLKANSTYMINIDYRFRTALYGPEGTTNYLTQYNYSDLTASITGRYSTGSGTIIPSNNRIWSKTSWAKYKDNGDWYGTYLYSYSNTFTPTTDISRLVYVVEKKSWLTSFGTYYASSTYLPYISIDNFQYEIVQLSDADTDKIIASSNKNADDIMNNANANADKITENQDKNTQELKDKLDDNNETNKSILENITNFFGDFFGNLIDGILGLFVPSDFDFLDGFLETLEKKLGFIASVPIQFLEFMIDLVDVDFDEITSITLPGFSIMGYDLWADIEIDLTDIINIFAPYRIYTNIGCVSLCIYYLLKQYENFANGGGQ